MVLPSKDESFPVEGAKLMRYDRVLESLGEGGVKPLSKGELSSLNRMLSESERFKQRMAAQRVLSLCGDVIDWRGSDGLELTFIRERAEGLDPLVLGFLDKLSNVGVTKIPREILVYACRDSAFLACIENEELWERFIATRLKELDSYTDRKAYVLALWLMEHAPE